MADVREPVGEEDDDRVDPSSLRDPRRRRLLEIDVLVVVRPAAPIQGAAALVKAPPLRRASRLGGVGRDGRKSSRNRGSARAVAPLDAARRAPRPAQIARPVVAGREPRRTPAVARLRDTRAAAGDDLVRGEDGRRRSW